MVLHVRKYETGIYAKKKNCNNRSVWVAFAENALPLPFIQPERDEAVL